MKKSFIYKYISGINEDVRTLLRARSINELDIEDVFTDTQLSKIETKSNYLYIALQFPEFDRNIHQFVLKQIHCFITDDYFFLIDENQYKHSLQFEELRILGAFKEATTSFHLFYEMLDFCVTKITGTSKKFKAEIDTLERDIFDLNTKDDHIFDIQLIKKNLINFESILLPLELTLFDLEHKNPFIDSWGKEKIDDSLDKIKKILNNLRNFSEQMHMITETNEALIARSTNQTIKFLTSLNIIALIPTIIVGFFGMNVYFGWDTSEGLWALAGIIAFMVISTGSIYFFFKKKDWI